MERLIDYMGSKYDVLFTPMKIGKVEIKNRIIMGAMGGANFVVNGKFNPKAAAYFIQRAKGGTGLLITGLQYVQDQKGLGLWYYDDYDEFVTNVKPVMDEIHSYGAKFFVQLTAGLGRVLRISAPVRGPLGEMNREKAVISASDLPNYWEPNVRHRPMTREEIRAVVEGCGKSAKMARDAGVDGVEIHAVHEGYLLDQFAVAATNQRTDEYGGSLENRLRFATEIVREIKAVCGEDYPVIMRYSVASKMKGFHSGALPGEPYVEFGRSLEESPRAAQILESAGYDALDTDNGSYDSWYWAHPPMYMPPACNLPESVYIKQFVKIPVFCGGLMSDPDTCARAVDLEQIDGVVLARPLLADPEWTNKVREGKLSDIRPCIACHNGCIGRSYTGKPMCCAVNPAVLRESEFHIIPAQNAKKVVVIGGGVGGMEAARVCALRGHKVTLFERSPELGGVLRAAAHADFKEADRKLLTWYEKQVADCKVEVRLNTAATAELVKNENPEAIIVAAGATAKKLLIPGIDGENVVEAVGFYNSLGRRDFGERVTVVGGGLTGVEIAYILGREGKKVTLVEACDDILQVYGLFAANSNMLREMLIYYGVEVMTSARLVEVKSGGIRVSTPEGEKVIATDSVVVSAGYDPDDSIIESLEKIAEIHNIGDSNAVTNLMGPIWDAYAAAFAI